MPLQLYSLFTLCRLLSSMRSVEFKVMALLMPLCGLSGAITQTSPNCFARLLKNKIPGAVMPSSLVMSMSFFWDIKLKDSKKAV